MFIGGNYAHPEYHGAVKKIVALVEQGKLKPSVVEVLPGGTHYLYVLSGHLILCI